MSRMSLGRLARVALTSLVGIGLGAGALVAAPPAQAEPTSPAPAADAGQFGWSPFFESFEGSTSGATARGMEGRPAGRRGGTRLLRRQLKVNVAYQQAVFAAEFASVMAEFEGEDVTLAFVREFLRPVKAMRPFIETTPISGNDFTLSMLADQACLSQVSENALIDVVRGACDGDPIAASRRPLNDLVRLLETARPGRRAPDVVATYYQHLQAPSILAAADRSITVVPTSITDADRDLLEDDGRYQVRHAGTSYCLQLPVARQQRTRLVRKRCAALPERDLAWVSDVINTDIDSDSVITSIRNVSRNSGKRISRLGARELNAVRATLGKGLTLTRTTPLRFRLTEDEKGCSVDIVFKADKVAAKARTTIPRCDG